MKNKFLSIKELKNGKFFDTKSSDFLSELFETVNETVKEIENDNELDEDEKASNLDEIVQELRNLRDNMRELNAESKERKKIQSN